MKKFQYKNPYLAKWVGEILHIYDFIYQANYYFIPAKNHNEFAQKCWKQLKLKVENKPEDNYKDGGFNVFEKVHKFRKGEETPICFIWANRPKEIIHECFHAVSYVLRNRGIQLTTETDEAYAYLLGFLTEQILKHLKV